MTSPRAAILVTGSELVRGDLADANGPFLARETVARGFEPTRITVVGDVASELEPALAEAVAADLCVISGGLGPTHDDRTIELLARVTGRRLVVDPELEVEIDAISRGVAERLGRPYADFRAGVRKQATLPEGATSLGLAGTAPGVLVEVDGRVAVALPGPPGELRRLWPSAVASPPFQRLLARTTPPDRRTLRFFGASESAVAQALADAGGDGHGVEATICARDLEIHVDLLADPGGGARATALADELANRLRPHLFARDARPVAEIVLALCRARGLSLATAESCTGGMVAEWLTDIPGSSDVFVGSVVSYSDNVKQHQLGVRAETLATHGAVSAEAADEMARGARERLGAVVAVAVTGVAGPGGGTPVKPVGLVFLHAATGDTALAARLDLPGDRQSIRRRATVTALHLVRRLLTQNGHERV